MNIRHILFAAACALPLAGAALAAPAGGHGPSGPHGGAGPFMGHAHGPIDHGHVPPGGHWNGHPFPHGMFQLPSPYHWHGDRHIYGRDYWRHGSWYHGRHDGRYGWWWLVGPDWYFYNAPVYPYPDSYTPPGEAPGWWYWCEDFQEYYPYVTYCPSGWVATAPLD